MSQRSQVCSVVKTLIVEVVPDQQTDQARYCQGHLLSCSGQLKTIQGKQEFNHQAAYPSGILVKLPTWHIANLEFFSVVILLDPLFPFFRFSCLELIDCR